MTDATPPTMIHLDERWDACSAPNVGAVEMSRAGFLFSVVMDDTLSPAASAMAVVIAQFAVRKGHDIPIAAFADHGPILDPAETLADLRELAEHGYISLGGGAE